MSPVLLALFPIPFIALGLLFARAAWAEVQLCVASRGWPPLTATVQSVTPVHAGNRPDHGGGFRHQFYVRYFYEVRGRRHWGSWTTPAARSVERARRLAPLTEGGAIQVFCCPTDPARSLAVRGWTLGRMLPAVAVAAFVVIPPAICWTLLAVT